VLAGSSLAVRLDEALRAEDSSSHPGLIFLV